MSNLDVGGRNAWSGPPDISTPWPSYITIDYVKVYQQSSSDHCTTHCLTGNLTSKVNFGCGKKRCPSRTAKGARNLLLNFYQAKGVHRPLYWALLYWKVV